MKNKNIPFARIDKRYFNRLADAEETLIDLLAEMMEKGGMLCFECECVSCRRITISTRFKRRADSDI